MSRKVRLGGGKLIETILERNREAPHVVVGDCWMRHGASKQGLGNGVTIVAEPKNSKMTF